ncbi:unnamed protein product [Caenorhabditis bovis]|uniref:Phospholipid/glycerol acyltransferase domain-containing protein n=1 Tax=Caenorhabditis bovis TaxID=2654633 RepID=A0A8S1E017_9PELO|nr:unnamed protein product [Caenorhabditis bovis]
MSSPGEPPVLGAGQPLSTRVKGWLFGAGMLISSLFGVLYIASPLVMLMFFDPRLYRKMLDRLVGAWVIFPGALMQYLFGAKVSVKGDMIDYTEPALIIMNHRTRLDWLFFWNALFKMDPWLCTTEKITLKGVLKYVPGAGWAMQAACYIFLDRTFSTDKIKLDSILNYLSDIGYRYQILLFPEGTDKCPKATERSRIHAEKKSLVHYNYVLHPRTTGFVHIVQTMRKTNNIKFLYDVTIGFGDAIVQSEVDLVVHGVCPKEVFYQIRKIPIEEIPANDEDLGKWLVELWRQKEEKLKKFYNTPRNLRQFENTPNGREYELNENLEMIQKMLVGIWLFVTCFWVYMFFESPIMFYYAIIMCVFYAAVYKIYGGLEFLAIKVFNQKREYKALNQSSTGTENPNLVTST